MSVGVVVDGGASLPRSRLGDRCIVVPMRLDEVPEGGSEDGGGAGTAAASPGAFLEAIEAADAGAGVVVVTVAEGLSASATAARAAADLAGAERGVRVVDSRSAAAGEGLVGLAAAAAAEAGWGLDEVAEAARRAAGEVRLVAQLERLDALARGGRLPPGVAALTRRAGLRILFELRDGRIRPLRPALGLAGAEGRIVAEVRASLVKGRRLQLAALHAGAPESAERLLVAVGAVAPEATRFRTELSPVMVAHTGIGVSGLAWRLVAYGDPDGLVDDPADVEGVGS